MKKYDDWTIVRAIRYSMYIPSLGRMTDAEKCRKIQQITLYFDMCYRAIEKFSTDAQDMVTSMLEPEVRKRPTANDLLLSSWFTIQDTNGARNSIELTKWWHNIIKDIILIFNHEMI